MARRSTGNVDSKKPVSKGSDVPVFNKFEKLTVNNAHVTSYTRSDGVKINVSSNGEFEVYTILTPRKVISGDCIRDSLKPEPVSASPFWYFDCNYQGPARTIRLYRISKLKTLIDVTHFQYDPKRRTWNVESDIIATSSQKVLEHQPLEAPRKRKASRPSLLSWLYWLSSLLLTILRFLLRPLADKNWKQKFLLRQFRTRLEPLETFDLGLEHKLNLMGDFLNPLQLRSDGKVRINDEVYDLSDTNVVLMHNTDQNRVFAEWHGGLLVVHGLNRLAIVIYENSRWRQFGFVEPSILNGLYSDFSGSSHFGGVVLRGIVLILLVFVFILLIISFLANYYSYIGPQLFQ